MENEFWQTKLTPYDAELAMMVESLTGIPCKLKNGGDHYFFEANYRDHNDPQYILAIWDAIEGRAGDRLIEIQDQPERTSIFVRVKFSEQEYPGIVRFETMHENKPEKGDSYCRQLEEIRAMQVKRENVGRLLGFVGNGEMEIPKDGPATFHFRNAFGSVFEHAAEFDYIMFVKDGLFVVVGKEKFEREYERK